MMSAVLFFAFPVVVPAQTATMTATVAKKCVAIINKFQKKAKIQSKWIDLVKLVCVAGKPCSNAREFLGLWLHFLKPDPSRPGDDRAAELADGLGKYGAKYGFVQLPVYSELTDLWNEKLQSFDAQRKAFLAFHAAQMALVCGGKKKNTAMGTGTGKKKKTKAELIGEWLLHHWYLIPIVIVQQPDECVATTYYVSRDKVFAPEGGSTEGEPASGRPTPGEQPGVPDCPKEAPLVVVTAPPKSPPPNVREAPKSPLPTTVTEVQPKAPPEKPDLGLVKAKEKVVKLALSGKESGKAYEGAAVKLVAAAPELPAVGKKPDPALTSAEAYASDEAAGYSNKDGTVSISLSAAIVDAVGDAKTEQANKGASPPTGIALSEVKVDDKPKGQLVITMKVVDDDKGVVKEGARDGAKSAPVKVASKSNPRLPASLVIPGSDLCIAHSFRIGKQVSYVARVAKPLLDEVKRKIEHTEDVYSVEEDPCRGKEAVETTHVGAGAD